MDGLLKALAYQKDPIVRKRAVEALCRAEIIDSMRLRITKLRGRSKDVWVRILTTALHDSLREVRWTAAWVLGEIRDIRAIGPLRSALDAAIPKRETLQRLGLHDVAKDLWH